MAAVPQTLLRTATLVVRRPLITATLTPFQESYYQYHEQLRGDHSREIVEDFWTKKGAKQQDALTGIEIAEPAPRTTAADAKCDTKSLDRKLEEKLYLVVKRTKSEPWGLVSGDVNAEEPLHKAAQRNVSDLLGNKMNLWMVGRAPIALSHKPATDNAKTFIHKAHVLSGNPNPASGVSDYAWVTKSEMVEYLDKEAHADVADLL